MRRARRERGGKERKGDEKNKTGESREGADVKGRRTGVCALDLATVYK